MFGHTTVERLKLRSALLAKRQPRGRRKKSEKAASGSRLSSGVLSQQVDGMTLMRDNKPIMPLKGLAARVGRALTYEDLVSNNMMAGRIQVSNFKIQYNLRLNEMSTDSKAC